MAKEVRKNYFNIIVEKGEKFGGVKKKKQRKVKSNNCVFSFFFPSFQFLISCFFVSERHYFVRQKISERGLKGSLLIRYTY